MCDISDYPQFMKDNLKDYEARREVAKRDKLENKKTVIVTKQNTIIKNGKKIIVPSRVQYEEDKDVNNVGGTVVNINNNEGMMDEEK